MLELRHPQVEGDAELPEDRLGEAEAAVDSLVLAARGVEAGAEPGGLRVERRRALSRRKRPDGPQQVLDAPELAELEGGLDRLDEVSFDFRARARELLATSQSQLCCSERFRRLALGAKQPCFLRQEPGEELRLLPVALPFVLAQESTRFRDLTLFAQDADDCHELGPCPRA